jgi:hypothetical protein
MLSVTATVLAFAFVESRSAADDAPFDHFWGMPTSYLTNAMAKIQPLLPRTNPINDIWIHDSMSLTVVLGDRHPVASTTNLFVQFQSTNAEWRIIGQQWRTIGQPLLEHRYNCPGMSLTQFVECFTEIAPLLPEGESGVYDLHQRKNVLRVTAVEPKFVVVDTGWQGGRRAGAGCRFEFRLIKGRWKKTAELEWVS